MPVAFNAARTMNLFEFRYSAPMTGRATAERGGMRMTPVPTVWALWRCGRAPIAASPAGGDKGRWSPVAWIVRVRRYRRDLLP